MNKNENKLIYVGYCRRSQDSDERQVLSIDSQQKHLKIIAAKENIKVIETLSESQSAYKPGREQFDKMLKMIEAGKANCILTYHATRLARNSLDGGRIIYMMDQGLIKEIKTSDGVFRNNGDDKFMLQIHFAMSKKSSDDTSKFVIRDLQAKVDKGEHPGYAPLGYLNIDHQGKISGKQYTPPKQRALEDLNRPLRRIEPDPLLAPVIANLFNLCSTGNYTLDRLAEETYSSGLTGLRSKKKVAMSTIHRIMTNPFYYGALPWKGVLHEPEELPEENRHFPIISKELFERVQEVLGLKSKPIKNVHFYPFSTYIRCDKCGGYISGLVAKGHTYYRCAKCVKLGYIREEELVEQIAEIVKQNTIDDNYLKIALEQINLENESEISKRDEYLKKISTSIERCKNKIDNLVRLKISPDNIDGSLLSDEEFVEQKNEIISEKSALQERLADIEANHQCWYDDCVDFVSFNHDLYKKFVNGTPEQKRTIFRFICSQPIITGKILLNKTENPHKYIIDFNLQKQVIITANNSLNKTKEEAFVPLLSIGRTGRDSKTAFGVLENPVNID